MRFGISVPNTDAATLVELAIAAERSGWDGFFLWDHINAFPVNFDPWVLLGAMAARTSRVRLGTLVTPVPRRRPWKLAKEVTTLDHLSGGRAVLGVGLGTPPHEEYAAFGEPADQRTHAAMLDEALPLLDRFLRGEPVDHDGEYYHVHTQLGPPAVQRPRPPIWAAATIGRDGPLRRALRCDGVFPLALSPAGLRPASPDELNDLVAALDAPPGFDVVAALGRDYSPSDLEAAGATWAIEGPDPEGSDADLRALIESGPPRVNPVIR